MRCHDDWTSFTFPNQPGLFAICCTQSWIRFMDALKKKEKLRFYWWQGFLILPGFCRPGCCLCSTALLLHEHAQLCIWNYSKARSPLEREELRSCVEGRWQPVKVMWVRKAEFLLFSLRDKKSDLFALCCFSWVTWASASLWEDGWIVHFCRPIRTHAVITDSLLHLAERLRNKSNTASMKRDQQEMLGPVQCVKHSDASSASVCVCVRLGADSFVMRTYLVEERCRFVYADLVMCSFQYFSTSGALCHFH